MSHNGRERGRLLANGVGVRDQQTGMLNLEFTTPEIGHAAPDCNSCTLSPEPHPESQTPTKEG